MRIRLGLAALLFAGCGTAGLDEVRFHNRAPVAAVNDRRPLAEQPAETEEHKRLYHYDALVHRQITQATELEQHRRARGVNALGEVPDSTWFTNRVEGVSPAQLRRGPNRGPGPMARKPWKIVSGKESGEAPGFVIEDRAGTRYLIKFDTAGFPETQSGAHTVVHRLIWALGYNVPEDWLVELERDDLVLTSESVIEDAFGDEKRMRPEDVERVLDRIHIEDDGTIRALASQFVPGKPLGPIAGIGVREGDPNDVIPHQDRRDMRGLEPISAWLKHTDYKASNLLDAWVEDPEHPERGYVVHYLIDFGKALGVISRTSRWRSDGYAHFVDFQEIGTSLLTFGLYRRPWENLEAPEIRGLGLIEAERYDPGAFQVRSPWPPFERADRFDRFWGAKLIMKLSPAHVRAAVEAARYSDPRATERLTDVLIARQRKTAHYWFRRVNPLDDFAVERGEDGLRLCFDDLMVKYRLEPEPVLAASRYGAVTHDHQGRRTGWSARRVLADGSRVCVPGIRPAAGRSDQYTIVAVETERPGVEYEPVLVHLARDPDRGGLRVIGVRRQ